jgi:membrane protease YdiL (CAAX protease family)
VSSPAVTAHSKGPARAHAASLTSAWILIVLGIGVMMLRPFLVVLPAGSRTASLALLAGATLLGSLLLPVPADAHRSRLSRVAGLAVGMGAVGFATTLSGPPVPMPFAAWALPLALLAAVAEEALFRRVAYGWLARWGVPVAVLGSATMFALVHVPLYGVAVLPVDLGAGLLLSWQRWATGTWTVPAATHAAANLIATVMR